LFDLILAKVFNFYLLKVLFFLIHFKKTVAKNYLYFYPLKILNMLQHKIVAGNWKMNKDYHEALELVNDLTNLISEKKPINTTIIISPPFLYIKDIIDMVKDFDCIYVSAQNCSNKNVGAHTGEVSAQMLASVGVDYCIVGHSERREYFAETDSIILEKIKLLLENNLKPIYCCGEKLKERENDSYFSVVENQLNESVLNLNASEIVNTVIAYEPVWAIGTGKTATAEQAGQMHQFIFDCLTKKYGFDIASQIPILYGGSCNSKNAKELFATKHIHGGLIGGASLVADDFYAIINS
jgi:triosephosphate isomerase (TIM)